MPHHLWRMKIRADAAMAGLPSRIAALERSLAHTCKETVEQVIVESKGNVLHVYVVLCD